MGESAPGQRPGSFVNNVVEVPTSRKRSPLARVFRIMAVPLLLLAVCSVLPTELHWYSIHTLVGSAIPDVIYLGHAAFGLAQGHTPYAAFFLTRPDQRLPYLYPPVTLLLSLPPVLAGARYTFAFSIEMLLFGAVGVALVGFAARRLGARPDAGLVVSVLILAFGPIVSTRVDGIQGLMVAGSALALAGRRQTLAVALVALAVLVKETAVLAAVPVALWVLLPDGASLRPLGARLRTLALGLAPAVLILLVFIVWSRGGLIMSSLDSIHRAMEIESVPATVVLALSHFMAVRPYAGRLGSWELRAADTSAIALGMSSAGALFLVLSSWAFAARHQRPATAMACAVAIGLSATPVLSPQYLLDLAPLVAVAASLEIPRRLALTLLSLTLLVGLLTQAEFPYLFPEIVKLAPPAVIVLAARNLALIAVAAILGGQAPWSSLRAGMTRLVVHHMATAGTRV